MSYLYRLDSPDQPPFWPVTQPYLKWVLRLHQATHLLYDFRLELDRKLISWVLREPPSRNPYRILKAVPVDDHNLKNLLTQRRIPEGQYGAEPFPFNDQGLYEPLNYRYGSHEMAVREALKAGCLEFRLHGQRLQGLWRIEQSGGIWLFTKLFDEHATQKPIKWEQTSVLTLRNLDEV